MALLKVKGEIQELLSHSQAILARKNKCLAIVRKIIVLYFLYATKPYIETSL